MACRPDRHPDGSRIRPGRRRLPAYVFRAVVRPRRRYVSNVARVNDEKKDACPHKDRRLSFLWQGNSMANSTILYACTHTGLAIFNKPGTLPEWLPPRPVLQGKEVTSAWGEPGPPIRVLAAVDGALQLSENGGRTWEPASLGADAGSSPFMSIFYVADT